MKYSVLKQIFKDAWRAVKFGYLSSRRDRYGYIHPTAVVYQPTWATKSNMFLYENTKIGENSQINAHKGKFIMKQNSQTGMFFTVIAQNHKFNIIGTYPGGPGWNDEEPADVVVEEDVWIGTNVTLCPGVHIGRGSVVAAGSVCVKSKESPPLLNYRRQSCKVLKI